MATAVRQGWSKTGETAMPRDPFPSNDRRAGGIDRRTVLRRAAFATGGLVLGGEALAQEAQTISFPFELTVPGDQNPCINEDVIVTGTLRIVSQAGPGDHVNFKLTAHGTGVGVDTGTEWIWNDTFRFNANATGAETITVTLSPSGDVGSVRLISKGSTDNFLVTGFLHMTTNANGDVTAVKLEPADAVCRG